MCGLLGVDAAIDLAGVGGEADLSCSAGPSHVADLADHVADELVDRLAR